MYEYPTYYETKHIFGSSVVFSRKSKDKQDYFPFAFSEDATEVYYAGCKNQLDAPCCGTKFMTDLFLDDIWEQELISKECAHYVVPIEGAEPNSYVVSGEIAEIYDDLSALVYIPDCGAFIRVGIGLLRRACKVGDCICSKGWLYIETEIEMIDIIPKDLDDYKFTEVIVDRLDDDGEYEGQVSFYPSGYADHLFRTIVFYPCSMPKIARGERIRLSFSSSFFQGKRVDMNRGSYLESCRGNISGGVGRVFRIEKDACYIYAYGIKICLYTESTEGIKVGDKMSFDGAISAAFY